MLSKLKVFFLVVTCSLSLGLSFFLPVLPNQKIAFAESDSSSSVSASPPVFDADENGRNWKFSEKQKVLSGMGSSTIFLFFFAKSPEIVAIDPKTGKDAIYKFDKVVPVFRTQVKAQQVFPNSVVFNWNQVSESVKNQILQFFKKNGDLKDGGIATKFITKHKKTIAYAWNTIQSLVYQINTLGIETYQDFLGESSSFRAPFSHNKWNYFKKDYTYEELENLEPGFFPSFRNFLFCMLFLPFAQQTFTAALDKDWLSKLKVLQSAPGLASLRVDEKDVNVSSLTSSNAQHIAGLGKDQTDILVKFKETTYLDLQKLVAPHIKLLTDYKKTIQTSLNLFAKYGITNPNLNGKDYVLSELLKPDNISKPAAELSVPAVQQLGNLYKVTSRIGSQHFTTAFAPIKTYKDNIQPSLDSFAQHDIITFTLKEVNYQLNHLLDTNNLGKSAADLSAPAAKQLKTLYDAKVKSEDFTTALNQILTTRKTQVQKEKEEKAATTKKTKAKKTALTIGLATGGGVLLLAGGTGDFLYWFYKIKK